MRLTYRNLKGLAVMPSVRNSSDRKPDFASRRVGASPVLEGRNRFGNPEDGAAGPADPVDLPDKRGNRGARREFERIFEDEETKRIPEKGPHPLGEDEFPGVCRRRPSLRQSFGETETEGEFVRPGGDSRGGSRRVELHREHDVFIDVEIPHPDPRGMTARIDHRADETEVALRFRHRSLFPGPTEKTDFTMDRRLDPEDGEGDRESGDVCDFPGPKGQVHGFADGREDRVRDRKHRVRVALSHGGIVSVQR